MKLKLLHKPLLGESRIVEFDNLVEASKFIRKTWSGLANADVVNGTYEDMVGGSFKLCGFRFSDFMKIVERKVSQRSFRKAEWFSTEDLMSENSDPRSGGPGPSADDDVHRGNPPVPAGNKPGA